MKFSRSAEGGIGQWCIIDPEVPSVEVFDLVADDYQLAASAIGDEIVTLMASFALSMTPSGMVRR